MKIGIDASRAFISDRTGIEEYSYQIIKNLRNKIVDAEIILYVKKTLEIQKGRIFLQTQKPDFELPKKWTTRGLFSPFLWSQLRLSIELFLHPVQTLFVPAHVIPLIHPKNSVVTIHGLEYEFVPESYSFWSRIYMRFSLKNSCRWAKKIICVSQNTQKDIMELYGVEKLKTRIIHEGCESFDKTAHNGSSEITQPYFVFVGRIEKRKNLVEIIEIFEKLKEKYSLPQKLLLIGKKGYGCREIYEKRQKSHFKDDIILTGYLSMEEKNRIVYSADLFFFLSKYEGFGLPILEAQNIGIPLVVADNSSLKEIAGKGAIYVDSQKVDEAADNIYDVLSDKVRLKQIIEDGYSNTKRFSWNKAACETWEYIK